MALQNVFQWIHHAAAVEDSPVTLSPNEAVCIACGFVDWLSERTGKPAGQLRVSVRPPDAPADPQMHC